MNRVPKDMKLLAGALEDAADKRDFDADAWIMRHAAQKMEEGAKALERIQKGVEMDGDRFAIQLAADTLQDVLGAEFKKNS